MANVDRAMAKFIFLICIIKVKLRYWLENDIGIYYSYDIAGVADGNGILQWFWSEFRPEMQFFFYDS